MWDSMDGLRDWSLAHLLALRLRCVPECRWKVRCPSQGESHLYSLAYGVTMDKTELMQKAIRLAVSNVQDGHGGPFAALVALDGEVIATGTNAVTSTNDPTAHAEIVAIRKACNKLGRFELSGCEIYSSCEPCPMCLGAIYWARPAAVYFAALRKDAADAGFSDQFISEQIQLPYGQQQIPFERLAHDDALLPFNAWRAQPNKVPY